MIRSVPLSDSRFGEGLALLNGKLYQLTWQSGVAYVYNKATLATLDSVRYPGEGWGLATDGRSLIMSDGSDSLRIMSPDFRVERIVHVRYQGSPLYKLNELEYFAGDILANVYETDWVVRIDLRTGNVKEVLDFADLYPDRPSTAEVMNGIAISPNGELLLTGKHWPVLFQVRLSPTAAN
jgi:glutaminyl-peptide cyclotransferase